MLTASTISAHDHVCNAEAALASNDIFAARSHFRAATEQDDSCIAAWLGLSAVTPALRDRRAHLQRVLTLNPEHEDARRQIAAVDDQLARGVHIQKIAPRELPARPAEAAKPGDADAQTTACFRHPERATGLHCISCARPICGSCASSAPVGHLCPACRRKRRPVNYQVTAAHIASAAAVAGLGGLLASAVLSFVVSGFLGFYIAMGVSPFVGAGLAMIIDRVTHAKRGKPIQIATGVATCIGMLPMVLGGRILIMLALSRFDPTFLAAMMTESEMGLSSLILASIDPTMVLFMGLTALAAMYRLR